ncbi:hypothetical protein F5X96DRAFT_693470 [Biscogniauxia mediterranea]|nr:hypothetical protein F5X96DRAFT_693470 [Biscogniauxia mediterranea]
MGKPLPLFMTLVPHGGLTWYSPKGARLLSNRDSRKLAKAFKYGLPRLTPRVVDKYAARLFVLAVEQVVLCATTPSREWFWCTVGERLAWCRKLADPALLVKFVHTCMCAQTMYAAQQTDARQLCPAAGRRPLSELAVAVWRFKVAVAETLVDDVMARQLFVPPGVFSLNPKAEGPVAKRLDKRPMRRRHQAARKSLKAYEDASRRIEQDEPAKVQEVRGNTTETVDAVDMVMNEAPEAEAVPIQSPVHHVQSPERVPSPAPIGPSVREPLVSVAPMDSAKLQAMQLSQKFYQDDDEELYYDEIAECGDADDSDEENPEIDYEDSDSDDEEDNIDGEEEEDSDAESFCEGEDYYDDAEEEYYDDVIHGWC